MKISLMVLASAPSEMMSYLKISPFGKPWRYGATQGESRSFAGKWSYRAKEAVSYSNSDGASAIFCEPGMKRLMNIAN
jgi:hypothetical protein